MVDRVLSAKTTWMAVIALGMITFASRPRPGGPDYRNRLLRRQPFRRGQRLHWQRRHPAIPAADYYNGRFTNGGNWLDYLAHDLGVAAPVASLAGGSDYAFGGASTGTGTTTYAPGQAVPNVGTQIAMYLSDQHAHLR